VKFWAPILLAGLLAVGCQTESKPAPATSASVLDVSGPSVRTSYAQPASGYQPTGPYAAAPAPAATATPSYMLPSTYPPPEPVPATVVEARAPVAEPASARTAGGARYTVKPGDTLYHIAKIHYGDGKRWQQIASANPGVSPTSLRIGQVLIMP